MNRSDENAEAPNTSRFQSPRPETPEPDSRQGRRNAQNVQLLDEDGAISDKVRNGFNMHLLLVFIIMRSLSSA
jgi:hypothetical protein